MTAIGDQPRSPGAVVLVVEDDELVGASVAETLVAMGHEAIQAATAASALAIAETRDIEVVLLDLGLPDMNGLELLPRLLQIDENLAVVVVTGDSSIATVVEAMRLGAEGILVKPVTSAAIESAVAQAARQHRLRRHASVYRARVAYQQENAGPDELVGSSAAMQRVRDLVLRVASTDAAVVLTGESGTGKGVVARLIHRSSRRAHGPFVDISCLSRQVRI
jgi:DNA-binding NtrC family response regulator